MAKENSAEMIKVIEEAQKYRMLRDYILNNANYDRWDDELCISIYNNEVKFLKVIFPVEYEARRANLKEIDMAKNPENYNEKGEPN